MVACLGVLYLHGLCQWFVNNVPILMKFNTNMNTVKTINLIATPTDRIS